MFLRTDYAFKGPENCLHWQITTTPSDNSLQDNGICGWPWQTWGSSSTWDCWSDSDDSDSDNSNPQSEASALDLSSETRLAAFQGELPNPNPKTNNQQSEIPSVSNSCCMIDSKSPVMAEENQGSCSRMERPQYERDGWERVELDSLSRVQLCRTDERWSTSRHSHTVSFRKKWEHIIII